MFVVLCLFSGKMFYDYVRCSVLESSVSSFVGLLLHDCWKMLSIDSVDLKGYEGYSISLDFVTFIM